MIYCLTKDLIILTLGSSAATCVACPCPVPTLLEGSCTPGEGVKVRGTVSESLSPHLMLVL